MKEIRESSNAAALPSKKKDCLTETGCMITSCLMNYIEFK